MNQEVKDILNQRKTFNDRICKTIGNATKACIENNIPRSSFYNFQQKKIGDKTGDTIPT